jgi:hypothetical protein
MTGQPAVTPERIAQLAWGYAPPLILETAVHNGIFEYLEGGGKTAQEVAAHTRAPLRGIRAILNALTGFQLLTKDGDGRFALTPESSTFLVKGRPGYLGGLIKHTSTQLIPRWLKLDDIVREGGPPKGVNQEETGTEFFHGFVEDIFHLSYPAAMRLADALEVSTARNPVSVLDVASGSGVWGIALAEKSPQVRVRAVDWPGVLDVTRKVTTRHGVADRFTFIGGDLHTADFGTGHQIAILGHILHSEGEQRGRELLKRTFAALAPGGTIAIQEFLVDDDRTGPPQGLIFAVNMLVATEHGDTFSFREISSWLEEAGFADARLLQSPGPSPLILATKPK